MCSNFAHECEISDNNRKKLDERWVCQTFLQLNGWDENCQIFKNTLSNFYISIYLNPFEWIVYFMHYRNIMQFQISSRRENRQRDTWVIKIRVHRKVFRKQFYSIRCRRQHLWVVKERRYSRLTFAENTISNSPKVTRVKLLGSNGP